MESKAIDIVVKAFEWFNATMGRSDIVIARADIERLFTPDAKMVANGQVKCAGIDAHLKHFQEIQKKLEKFCIRLPLEVSISNQNEAAAYYKIDYTPVGGTPGIIHDSALWHVRDNKLALMVETVAFEGRDVALDNHG